VIWCRAFFSDRCLAAWALQLYDSFPRKVLSNTDDVNVYCCSGWLSRGSTPTNKASVAELTKIKSFLKSLVNKPRAIKHDTTDLPVFTDRRKTLKDTLFACEPANVAGSQISIEIWTLLLYSFVVCMRSKIKNGAVKDAFLHGVWETTIESITSDDSTENSSNIESIPFIQQKLVTIKRT